MIKRFLVFSGVFALLFAAFLLPSCIKEVDYGSGDEKGNELVVSGRITNLAERQSIRLMRPGVYKFQNFVPVRQAQITLNDDQGNTWRYEDDWRTDTVHTYYLDGFAGVPGRAYTLRIKLADGNEYETDPQVLPEPIPMDSLVVLGEYEQKVTPTGVFVDYPVVTGYANTTIPTTADRNMTLHWDVHQVWILDEISPQQFPPDPWVQCWVTDYFNRQNLNLSRLSDLQSGATIRQQIGKTGITYAFGTKTGWVARQFTTNKDAARYLEQTQSLLTQTGSIFDVPPAPVRGNVYPKGKREIPVLGFFEVAGADVKYAFIPKGSLGTRHDPYETFCMPVNYYDRPSNWYDVCWSCHTLPNSTVVKPVWWQ